MKLKYINKIKANISIYASKKTTNILDGTYKSVYKGKSMNFENLREYVINDDIKDIDWKASARSSTLLVKQYIAEKKHNILFIMDTGLKMNADSNYHESKKELALLCAGTLGYLAIENSDYIGMILANNDKVIYKPFKYNLYNLEEYLTEYDKYASLGNIDINDLLEYVHKNINKKMIIFIVTDLSGIESLNENVLKKLNKRHDVLVINILDNYMFGSDIYDVEDNKYLSPYFLNDSKLNEEEKKIKEEVLNKNIDKLKKNNVCITSIGTEKEINAKLIKLLEEHRYANNN